MRGHQAGPRGVRGGIPRQRITVKPSGRLGGRLAVSEALASPEGHDAGARGTPPQLQALEGVGAGIEVVPVYGASDAIEAYVVEASDGQRTLRGEERQRCGCGRRLGWASVEVAMLGGPRGRAHIRFAGPGGWLPTYPCVPPHRYLPSAPVTSAYHPTSACPSSHLRWRCHEERLLPPHEEVP